MMDKPKWTPEEESACIRKWTENLYAEAKRLLIQDGTHAQEE